MTKHETYEAGLKLIGVYFVISGISILAMSILGLFQYASTAGLFDARVFKIILQSLLHPGTQIILGAVLIKKTDSIIEKLNRQNVSEQKNGH